MPSIRKISFLVVSIGYLALGLPPSAVGWNETFDDGVLDGWTIRGYEEPTDAPATMEISSLVHRSSPYSFHVDAPPVNGVGNVASTDEIPIDPDLPYRISFWFRYESYHWFHFIGFGPVQMVLDKPAIEIRYRYGSDEQIGYLGNDTAGSFMDPDTWHHFVIEVTPASEVYSVYVDGTHRGDAYYDGYTPRPMEFHIREVGGIVAEPDYVRNAYYDDILIEQAAQCPIIAQQPSSQAVCEGDPAVFSVQAVDPPASYQWRYNGSNILGATESSYTIDAVTVQDAAVYSVIVTDDCGMAQSRGATLTVGTGVEIVEQPTSRDLCEGETTTLRVTVEGLEPFTYQWRYNGVDIPGATEDYLRFLNATPNLTGTYDVLVTDLCGAQLSESAYVNIGHVPTFTEHPQSQTVADGEPVTLSGGAEGTQPLAYQWWGPAGMIIGATDPVYSIEAASVLDAGTYTLRATEEHCYAWSATATLVVLGPPIIVSDPRDSDAAEGYPGVILSVDAAGPFLSYQWRKDGQPILGATSKTLAFSDPITADDEGYYDVAVTNPYGSVVSSPAFLDVNLRPVAVLQIDTDIGIPMTTVSFDGAQSHDPEGEELIFTWDFGDGSATQTGPMFTSHTYERVGVYPATLTVLDDLRLVGTATVTIRIVDGPFLFSDAGDLWQDSFPNAGIAELPTDRSELATRLDMARDTNHDSYYIIPGDSIVVHIEAILPGTILVDPPGGAGGVLHWTLLANPTFDSVRQTGLTTSQATLVGVDGRGWNIWEGEVIGRQCTDDQGPVEHRYFFDLPDGPMGWPPRDPEPGFFFPGDVLQYYFQAEDIVGQVSTHPPDLTGLGDFTVNSLYPRGFTVRCLPTHDPGLPDGQPSLLIWNDTSNPYGTDMLLRSLGQLGLLEGIDFDLYTTSAPASLLSNGLGSAGAHGANPDQIGGYSYLLYLGEDETLGLLSDGTEFGSNDKSNDLDVLDLWFHQDVDRFQAYFGDNVVESLHDGGPAALHFLDSVLGASLVSTDVGLILGLPASFRVAPTEDPFYCFTETYALDGGPWAEDEFDEIQPQPGSGAVVSHLFLDDAGVPSTVPAGLWWDRMEGDRIRTTAVFPYGFSTIANEQQKSDGLLAGTELLRDLLNCWGLPTGGIPVDAPASPRAWTASGNMPNPFNPRTTVILEAPVSADFSVRVYDVRGREVTTLHEGRLEAGEHRLVWDGTDAHASSVASGVYFARIQGPGRTKVIKMALVR